jgi:hypothetical protein
MRPLEKGKMNLEQNFPNYFQKILNLGDKIILRG